MESIIKSQFPLYLTYAQKSNKSGNLSLLVLIAARRRCGVVGVTWRQDNISIVIGSKWRAPRRYTGKWDPTQNPKSMKILMICLKSGWIQIFCVRGLYYSRSVCQKIPSHSILVILVQVSRVSLSIDPIHFVSDWSMAFLFNVKSPLQWHCIDLKVIIISEK